MMENTSVTPVPKTKFNFFRTDLSPHITSYDLLKTFAIITMIIDHVGYFFYPDIQEFRVIGRLSAPVWFFLIGYALTRKLEWRFFIGGALVMASNVLITGNMALLLPLNILFTFLLIRFLMDWLMVRCTRKFEALFGVFWLCFLAGLPSMFVIEYGTLGLLFAMTGYLFRHHKTLEKIGPWELGVFTALSIISYIFYMSVWFVFSLENIIVLAVLLPILFAFISRFQSYEIKSDNPVLSILKYPLFMMGRRTLEIYVLHFIIFIAIKEFYGPF